MNKQRKEKPQDGRHQSQYLKPDPLESKVGMLTLDREDLSLKWFFP
jgi:hypothetical protein